jgi:hypothetical protein
MAVVEESEYKGNPMIVLRRNPEDRYPFQFGLSKAKLVLDAVEEIRAWVAKHEAERAAKAPAESGD